MKLSKALAVSAAIGALISLPVAAQKGSEQSRLSAGIQVGRSLDVSAEFVAAPFQEGTDLDKLGTVRIKKGCWLGGRTLPKGTFKLSLTQDGDDSNLWLLVLTPKKKGATVPSWPLLAPQDAGPSGAEDAGGGPDATTAQPFHLSFRHASATSLPQMHVEYGPLRAALPLIATATLNSATSKDPAIQAIDAQIRKAGIPSGQKPETLPKPTAVTEFSANTRYVWQLLTNRGLISVRLWPDVAPMHVTSTLYLTRAGFYENASFHRVIPGFMAQGGCPLGNGQGSSGYTYDGEIDPDRKHDRGGLLSMANSGPGTDNCQFFLTFDKAPHLDGKHTIFGEVIAGMTTLRHFESLGSPEGPTSTPLILHTATLTPLPN